MAELEKRGAGAIDKSKQTQAGGGGGRCQAQIGKELKHGDTKFAFGAGG
jgi:hypothetical protein